MKVLIIAGKRHQKLVEAAKKSFKETVEIDGLDYIENLGNFYLKGGIFDRAVIVEPGYTKDGENMDEFSIVDSIEKATNIVKKNSHSIISMVYVANEEDIAFNIVEATSNISGEVVVIHNEKKKITTSLLTKLIMTDMTKFSKTLKTISIGDLSKRAIDKAKEQYDGIEFGLEEQEQTEIVDDVLSGNNNNELVFDIDSDWENNQWGEQDSQEESEEDTNSDMHTYWNNDEETADFSDPNNIDFSDPFQLPNTEWGDGKDTLDIEEQLNIKNTDLAFKDEFENNDSDGFEDFEKSDGFEDFENSFEKSGSFEDEFEDSDGFEETADEFKSDTTDKDIKTNDKVDTDFDFDVNEDDFKFDNNSSDLDDTFKTDFESFEDSDIPEREGLETGLNSEFKSDYDFNDITQKDEDVQSDFGITEEEDVFGLKTNNWGSEFDLEETGGETQENREETNVEIGINQNSGVEQNTQHDELDKLYEDDWETVEPTDKTEISDIAELYEENELEVSGDIGVDMDIVDPDMQHNELNSGSVEVSGNHKKKGLFKGKKGDNQNKAEAPRQKQHNTQSGNGSNLDKKLKNRLELFKKKGCLMVVTGSDGAGKTTVAANIANLVCSYGLNVLLLDLDTKGRGQSYINYDNYITVHSSSSEVNNVKLALNSNNNSFERFIHIIRPGYHLLTGGLDCDKENPEEALNNKFINKFIHKAQASYNMIIVDAPFDLVTTKYTDMITAADDVILVEELTNRGMINLLINLTNVVNDEVVDILFDNAHILFNKDTNLDVILGKKVNDIHKALSVLDMKLKELSGIDTGYYFQNMNVNGIIKFDPKLERYWFTKKYFTDTPEGRSIFIKMLSRIYDLK